MKKLEVLTPFNVWLLVAGFLVYGCRQADYKSLDIIPLEIEHDDSLGLNNPRFAIKYGINSDNPPAWIGTDLVMEEVVEGIDQEFITINGYNLLDFQGEDIVKYLNLHVNKAHANYQDFTNDDKSLLLAKQHGNAISLQVDDVQKVLLKFDSVSLNRLDIYSFKKLFPGSYMFRNLYGIEETMHLAERDSVKTIDTVFLWALGEKNNQLHITGRLDLTFVNGSPLKAYFFSII